MFYLEIRAPSGKPTTHELSKSQPVSIGSHTSNDIRIKEDTVPAMYCRIGWNGKTFEVTAARPSGVEVNGTLIERAPLSTGDIVMVGSTDIVFQGQDAADALPPSPDEKAQSGRGRSQSGKSAREAAAAAVVSPSSQRGSKQSRSGEDDPWDPSAEEQSPSQVIHRSTTFAAHAGTEQKPGARPDNTPMGRIRGMMQNRPARPGEQDVLRSPFILTLGGGSLLLLLVGATFWFIIARDTASRQFGAAMEKMEQRQYSQAIADFDRFLVNYPKHKLTDEALEERGKAKIEAEIMGSTPSWQRGYTALEEFIDQRRDSPGFGKLHETLAGYSEQIARGAARSAEQVKDRELLTVSRGATKFLERFSPSEAPPAKAKREIETALEVAEAAILKQETLDTALSDMGKAIDTQQPMAALEARRNLLDRYRDLETNRTLVERLGKTLDVEKALVVREAADREAFQSSGKGAASVPLTLALHTRSRTDESSNGRCVFALAGGCVFGIDAVTGEPVWRHVVGLDSPFFPIEVTTAIPGLLVFDTTHQELQLLERTKGNLIWRQPLQENLTGAPLVHEGQVFATTDQGHLYRLDLETGKISGVLRFSQPVHGPPVLLSDGAHMAVAGNEDVIYSISPRQLACEAVSYIGHRPGSIQSPLMTMGKLVLMADNDRKDSSLLRVLRMADSSPSLVQVDAARIAGTAKDEPVLRGNELFVPSSGQRLTAFTVSDNPNEAALTSIANYQVQSEHSGPLHLAAGPDGQLWMASGALRKFHLTTDSIDLSPKVASVGLSTQPLQTIGNHLFGGRRLPFSNAVLFAQTDRDSMTSRWRTVLGGEMLQLVDAGDGTAVCITDDGDLFRVSDRQIDKGGFVTSATAQLRLPDGLIDPLRAASLSDGRLAVYCGAPEPTLWLLSSTGLLERTIPLDAPLEADPAMIAAGLVLPLPGQLKVVPRSTGQSTPDAFVSGLGKENKPRWLEVTAVDDQEVLALDSSGRLARIEFREKPLPHLAEVSGIQFSHPVDVPFVVRDGRVLLADAAGTLHLLDARSMEELSTAKLSAPATNALWLAGNHVYVETGGNQLECFEVGQPLKKGWTAPLEGEGLAGSPLVLNDQLVLAKRNGDILVLDPNTGNVVPSGCVRQQLSLGPRQVGNAVIAVGIDGSLYSLNHLISPAQ